MKLSNCPKCSSQLTSDRALTCLHCGFKWYTCPKCQAEWVRGTDCCSKCGMPLSDVTQYAGCENGNHIWAGCRCTKCGKTRDEGHNWGQGRDNCTGCGKLNFSLLPKSDFTVHVPWLDMSDISSIGRVLHWQGKLLVYNSEEVGRVSRVDVKTDGRVIVSAEIKSACTGKTLGSDLVLRD